MHSAHNTGRRRLTQRMALTARSVHCVYITSHHRTAHSTQRTAHLMQESLPISCPAYRQNLEICQTVLNLSGFANLSNYTKPLFWISRPSCISTKSTHASDICTTIQLKSIGGRLARDMPCCARSQGGAPGRLRLEPRWRSHLLRLMLLPT